MNIKPVKWIKDKLAKNAYKKRQEAWQLRKKMWKMQGRTSGKPDTQWCDRNAVVHFNLYTLPAILKKQAEEKKNRLAARGIENV